MVGLLYLAGLLVALDVWLYCAEAAPAGFRDLFDNTSERGLGSWLAVTQTGFIALTLWGVAHLHARLGASRGRRAGWIVLALFFAYLAFDDGTRFHERVGTAFAKTRAAETGLGGAFPSYYWQLLFGPFFAGMGLFMLVFLWRELCTRKLRLMVVAALGLLALAVAMDFVEGLQETHPLNGLSRLAATSLLGLDTYLLFGMSAMETMVHLARSVEESLEMMAMTTLWGAFLLHVVETAPEIRLRWLGVVARSRAVRPRARQSVFLPPLQPEQAPAESASVAAEAAKVA